MNIVLVQSPLASGCLADQWELYDLQTDPTEMNNLFDKPGYESIIEKLKQELVGLQTLYGDSIEYRLRDKKL